MFESNFKILFYKTIKFVTQSLDAGNNFNFLTFLLKCNKNNRKKIKYII